MKQKKYNNTNINQISIEEFDKWMERHKDDKQHIFTHEYIIDKITGKERVITKYNK